MIRAFDTTNSRALNFNEFQRLHYFLVNVQGSFQQFDRCVKMSQCCGGSQVVVGVRVQQWWEQSWE